MTRARSRPAFPARVGRIAGSRESSHQGRGGHRRCSPTAPDGRGGWSDAANRNSGAETLLYAFEGRRMLIGYYFMWHTCVSTSNIDPDRRPMLTPNTKPIIDADRGGQTARRSTLCLERELSDRQQRRIILDAVDTRANRTVEIADTQTVVDRVELASICGDASCSSLS